MLSLLLARVIRSVCILQVSNGWRVSIQGEMYLSS